MTVAQLGLAVDSSQVNAASPALEKMAAAARTAENAALGLSRAAGVEEGAAARATTAARVHTAALHAQAAAARMTANTSRMLAFQLNDVVVSLASGMNPAMVALQQGSQVAQLGMKEVAGAALGMVIKFAPVIAIAGGVAAAIAGMTAAINENSAVTVTFGDTALAVWQVVSSGIYTFVKPALDWLTGTLSSLWDSVAPALKTAGNAIIGTFVAAFQNIRATWALLPNALGDLVMQAANNVIAGVHDMLGKSVLEISGWARALSSVPIIGGLATGLQGLAGLSASGPAPKLHNPYAGGAAAMSAVFSDAYDTDYLGDFFGAVAGRAQKNAIARLAEDAEDAGKSAKEVFGDLIGMTNVFADATRSAFRNLGSGIVDAFKKGGDVAMNFFDMILDRVGQVGESLLNTGLNTLLDIGINALFGGLGGGLGTGAIGRGVYGGMGGFFPAFPGMAGGGTVEGPGLSWVGEHGKELLYMPRGAQVIPHQQSMQMANDNAANSNGRLHVTVGVEVINGNLMPTIARVTGEVAGRMIDERAPLAVAKFQRDRRGG